MSYLIEKNGERRHVGSLAAYPDWTVVSEGNKSRPVEHAAFDETSKSWKVDPQAKAEAARKAQIRAMATDDRFDMLMDEIERLKAQIAMLENIVQAL